MPERKTSSKRKASNPDTQLPDKTPIAKRVPMPSTNPATNLLIADIVVRGASTLLRKSVDKRVVKASADSDEHAREVLDGRTILTTIGLYGASKIATRSLPGLALVTGGLVAKTLYDRGKFVQARKRFEKASAKAKAKLTPEE